MSFEPEPRCKNCGYDLAVQEADLVIQVVAEAPPLADLSLREPAPPRRVASAPLRVPARSVGSLAEATYGGVALADEPMTISAPAAATRTAAAASSSAVAGRGGALDAFASEGTVATSLVDLSQQHLPRGAHATAELPLFVKAMLSDATSEIDAPSASDEPLVKVPAEPRPPLGVRRSSAETPKPRAATSEDARRERKLGPFDRDLLDDLRRVDNVDYEEPRPSGAAATAVAPAAVMDQAGSVRRLFAASVDLILLGAMTAGVVWVTFRLADVAPTSVGAPVLVPLGAFVLLLNLGYLVMFTAAGGQTVGKMLTGIRVIGTTDEDATEDRVTLRQAIYREVLTLPLLLPLGAGLLPAIFGKGLAVHDRLAHTRVVRA